MQKQRSVGSLLCFVWLASLTGLVCGGTAALGAMMEKDSASGTMTRDGDTLTIVDGWATADVGFLDGQVIRVVLVPMELDRHALAAHIDFDYEIARQKRESGLPGSLEIEIDRETGRWRGMSYGLPGGWGCGYCSVKREQTLDLSGGRVRGRLELDPGDDSDGKGPQVRLDIDLEISAVVGASPLGADGGAPGAALLGCWDVAKEKAWDAIGQLCFVPGDEHFRDTDHMDDETRTMMVFWGRGQLRADELEIEGGRTKGDFAQLDLKTRKGDERFEGTMLLRRTEVGWRVVAQTMSQIWD